jgi:Protein of unknown function (DUF2637)
VSGRAAARETAASAFQYLLLGGFTAVATGISAQGLTGFARANMGLTGPWPYLLFLALDGAAGVCAVLLTRRAARDEPGLGPRLAVWGLVATSATFNASHAPHKPGAPEAFAMMPVVAAVLFEFTLRELRERKAGRTDRRIGAVRWLYPIERFRVQRTLAADEHLSAQAATRRVRTEQAARRLYQLRGTLTACDGVPTAGALAARRARAAERRAHAALIRAGFSGDRAVAADVLRHVQVLTQTAHLALLDYATPGPARDVIAGLITAGLPPAPTAAPLPTAGPGAAPGNPPSAPATPSGPPPRPAPEREAEPAVGGQDDDGPDAGLDGGIVTAAAGILADARRRGKRLSQKALGAMLRQAGHRVANESLGALLAAASGQAGTSAPSGPDGGPGDPPAVHPVNGKGTALAARLRLPGDGPGSDGLPGDVR